MNYKCIDNLADGQGVFNVDGKKIFVKGALKDEIVTLEKKKHYELKNIVSPSKDRIKVICPEFCRCGGCQYLNVSYDTEKNIKQKYINRLFNKEIPFTFMENPLNYRNKVQYTFKQSKRGSLALGLYQDGSHDLITINECHLHNEVADKVAKIVLDTCNKYKLSAYDEKSGSGILRHLLIRYSQLNNECLVVLVLNTKVLPKRKDIIKEIITKAPEVTSIVENYNFRKTPIVLGELENVIYGKGYIVDEILGAKFMIYPKTFYQINNEGVKLIYKRAIDLLKPEKKEILVDAYSGVGTIGIIASKNVGKVYSIENNPDSVKSARINAKNNNIRNIEFILGDATTKLNEFYLKKIKVDSIIMDPPRDGSTKQFINAIAKLKINKVIYISCEPTTLKRDLEIFKSLNYDVTVHEAYDMFPRTFNVECVCRLERKNK